MQVYYEYIAVYMQCNVRAIIAILMSSTNKTRLRNDNFINNLNFWSNRDLKLSVIRRREEAPTPFWLLPAFDNSELIAEGFASWVCYNTYYDFLVPPISMLHRIDK